MVVYCQDHEKTHTAYQWKSWVEDDKVVYVCRDRLLNKSLYGKKQDRLLHWKEIQSRVRTQDGELIKGANASKHRQKYLGLSKPTNFEHPIYQKELNKTK